MLRARRGECQLQHCIRHPNARHTKRRRRNNARPTSRHRKTIHPTHHRRSRNPKRSKPRPTHPPLHRRRSKHRLPRTHRTHPPPSHPPPMHRTPRRSILPPLLLPPPPHPHAELARRGPLLHGLDVALRGPLAHSPSKVLPTEQNQTRHDHRHPHRDDLQLPLLPSPPSAHPRPHPIHGPNGLHLLRRQALLLPLQTHQLRRDRRLRFDRVRGERCQVLEDGTGGDGRAGVDAVGVGRGVGISGVGREVLVRFRGFDTVG
mmetsp:Transcript_27916/g.52633  ORF Transcript_27916/g.52633 Transcript_27916/m.52633 type:complete len:260 (-) Transcript_27916:565-1344(-)